MPQKYNKNLTRASDSKLKNIDDAAKRDNEFLEQIPTALTPAAHSVINKIPMVGSTLSKAVQGVEDKLTAPIRDQYNKNLQVRQQVDNENWARLRSGKSGHERARTLRDLLGVKNDPNEFGITALSGLSKTKGKQ